jgi:ketosteroid isomerase-like protein
LTVKRCPTCNQTFTEAHLSFCIDDGTPLVPVDADAAADPAADEATVVRSAAASDSYSSGSADSHGRASESPVPAYQRPGSYVPPDYKPQQGKRKTWPWLLGLLVIVLVIFAGLGIAAALLVPRSSVLRSANRNNSNVYVVPNNSNSNRGNSNENMNSSDWNENLNSNSNDDVTKPAPIDQAQVLSDLTALEHEWTVANINADKKKLNRILADDYVATLPNGNLQGKAEYLRTAERDDATQKWAFEDLKVSLRGDRATLTGVLQLEVRNERGQNHSLAYRFIDKFVWRDGRWQATASEVQQVKREGISA